MVHRRRPRISRFQLYIALTGVAFTMISAGEGLMQTYLSSRLILATNTSRINPGDEFLFYKGSNFAFPLGEFLLIFGLAIIFSILLQSVLQFGVQTPSNARKWLSQGRPLEPLVAIVVLAIGLTIGTGLAVYFFPPDLSTINNLVKNLQLHHNLPSLFIILTILLTGILYIDGRSRH